MDLGWIRAQLKERRMTQADLAAAIGIPQNMLTKGLNGHRDMRVEEVDAIRRAFGYRLPEDPRPPIAVIARVSAGEGVLAINDHAEPDGLFRIKRPDWIPDEGVGAAVVDGSSAEPFALPGDIVFWCRESDGVLRRDVGRPVIAQLADGRTMLKRLAEGSKRGFWNLLSINPSYPGHMDVELAWASRVFTPLAHEEMVEVAG